MTPEIHEALALTRSARGGELMVRRASRGVSIGWASGRQTLRLWRCGDVVRAVSGRPCDVCWAAHRWLRSGVEDFRTAK